MATETKGEAAPDTGKRTLGAYANLPGSPIEEIEGQEVTIARIEISTRRFREDPEHPFAVIATDDGTLYHTWSTFLIEKLEQIPADALPGQTTFRKVKTDKGRMVWNLE